MAQFIDIEEEEVKKQRLLQELYTLNDEYNEFVRRMDRKLDIILSKVESLHESETVQ